jgi:DNA-binding NarL/FixJ family response regulator
VPVPPADDATVDDHTLVHDGVGAFLKVFDDIKLRDAASEISAQNSPEVVVIDRDEFNKRVAEHEAERLRINRIKMLIDNASG